MTSRIFCAIDTTDLEQAKDWVHCVTPHIQGIKLGMEFFYTHGKNGVKDVLSAAQKPVDLFLDLKLHDIPNTVAGALRAVTDIQPKFITLHSAGGAEMIKTAVKYLSAHCPHTQILAVTILTHLGQEDLHDIGYDRALTEQVSQMGQLAVDNGAQGLVCSPKEVATLRAVLGPDVILMVPGIRPNDISVMQDDQNRTLSPQQAFDAGATHLVIGRPITQAINPAKAAQNIVKVITPCIAAA